MPVKCVEITIIMRFIATVEPPKVVRLRQVLKKKKALGSFFRRRPIELVFVHGALAKDNMKALSDVDVAVLFRDEEYSCKEVGKSAMSPLDRESIQFKLNRIRKNLGELKKLGELTYRTYDLEH